MALNKLMTEQDVAPLLAVSLATLRRWRSEGKGPPFVKLDGSVRYRAQDLETWIEKRLVIPSAERLKNQLL